MSDPQIEALVADYRLTLDRLARAQRAGDLAGQVRALGELLNKDREKTTAAVRRDVAVRYVGANPGKSLAQLGEAVGLSRQKLNDLCTGHPDRVARPAGGGGRRGGGKLPGE